MAFLDFIRNRQEQSADQSSQSQKPETAREMYSREAGQGAPGQRAVGELPESAREQAREIGARLDKATQHLRQDSAAPSPAPESTGSPEPMRQSMMGQDNAAPALSPTSAQRGAVAHEQESPAPSREESQSIARDSQRPQTIARPTPSWER
jgi:hypothetical protein